MRCFRFDVFFLPFSSVLVFFSLFHDYHCYLFSFWALLHWFHSFIDPFIHTFAHSFIHSFIHSVFCCLLYYCCNWRCTSPLYGSLICERLYNTAIHVHFVRCLLQHWSYALWCLSLSLSLPFACSTFAMCARCSVLMYRHRCCIKKVNKCASF